MMNKVATIFFLLLFPLFLKAQGVLNNGYSFTNGLYQTFEEFKENAPGLNWNDVTSDLIVMEPIHKAKMIHLKNATTEAAINMDEIWGFCVNGIPYKKVDSMDGVKMFSFAGIQLRGKICYFEYEILEEKEIEVKAYNPLTNKPFRKGKVKQENIIPLKVMMDFETGETDLYTRKNVENWISSDEKLLATFQKTEEIKLQEQLFKFLQIFNDRNPIKMKK